ncbi:hypothetical protein ACFLZG_06990, partial [Thermodesulfobacteriota bacterium]
MQKPCHIKSYVFTALIVILSAGFSLGANAPISEDTETCIDCHASLHPGIIEEWRKSSHAKTTPAQGLKK